MQTEYQVYQTKSVKVVGIDDEGKPNSHIINKDIKVVGASFKSESEAEDYIVTSHKEWLERCNKIGVEPIDPDKRYFIKKAYYFS